MMASMQCAELSVRKMIPIIKPWMDEREAAAAGRVILSGWVTQGPEVAAFETEFAAATEAPYSTAVSNCTTALHLALLAVGVKPSDEVITVSHSFIATANAIRYCGAIPVFVDIDPATCNMDPALVEAAITSRTRAILCVHQMGMPCDMARLAVISRNHGLPLIEDAACAIGSHIQWKGQWEPIGKPHGDIACFSFHPRKIVSTGDGGMLTTSNPVYNALFRQWRQHSMSVSDTVRHGSNTVVIESYSSLGFNYRMTDIQAAVGREQLKRLPQAVQRRRELAARYCQLLESIPGLTLPVEPEWAHSNWQSFHVRLDPTFDQRRVMQELLTAGISARRGIMCAHREPAYSVESWRTTPAGLGHSEQAQDHRIILPLFHQMTEDEQQYIADTLRRILAA